MKIFAAHNPEPEIRENSSSGGIFTILAKETISTGGVVYGAAFDSDFRVVHRRVETVEDISLLRGSKYVYSLIGDACRHALADLAKGRKVLFSGTPCQTAAMRKLAGDNSLLLLVEVVCHGAPEPKYWESYLSELLSDRRRTPADIKSVNFRDKRTGWKSYSFTICYHDGQEFSQLHDDNPYMRAFLSDMTLRKACFKCPFKYPGGSKADITLGDLWGIEHIAPEIDNDRGTTLVIARTAKGISALATVTADAQLNFENVSRYNPALVRPATVPTDYDKFREEAANAKSLIKLFNKYAGMPLLLKIKTRIYRLIHSL